jgi:multiple sugar transport system substrate-binding protein
MTRSPRRSRIAACALTAAVVASVGMTASVGAQGSFDWKAHSGESITFLANDHPWTTGMMPLLDQFTTETGIKVDVQPFAEEAYFDKMPQVLRGSEGSADVYFLPMDSTAYSQYQAGLIEPLTPYLKDPTKTSPDFDLADFPQGFLDPGTYPLADPAAQLYGMPISFETYILFSNKDLVDKYLGGVMPKTFKELVAAAKTVSEKGAADGVVGAVMRGVRSDTLMDTLSGVVFDAFGAAAAPAPFGLWFDGAWDKPRLTDPAVCQGLANYAGMVAAGPANKFALDWPAANQLFQQGKAAFLIDASLFGPSYEDPKLSVVGGKVGYDALPPAAAGGTSYTGHWLWGLGIPKNAANKDAAWYFIQWMTDKANTARIGATTGGAPRLSSYSDPVYTGALKAAYIAAVNAAMSNSRTTVVFKEGWADATLAIVDTMLAIANGADPTAACATGNEALLAAAAK